jgi:phosphatidylserine decarboxylase
MMTLRAYTETLNFLVTNRIPRRLTTRVFGWFSKIEQPLVRDVSLFLWRLTSDLDLRDAAKDRFRSLHDCFIRTLRDGARPVDADPDILVSPCDAIVGAHGVVTDGQMLQIKGSAYPLRELLRADQPDAGTYVTLRLTATMYHHFHAPADCRVESTTYIPGDTWNVNPPALKRVDRLFCKNERAVIRLRLSGGEALILVPVAAILVASLRLRYLPVDLRTDGPRTIETDIPLAKGAPMGWFQHGSTIVVLAPPGFSLCENVRDGSVIRMGQALMRRGTGVA